MKKATSKILVAALSLIIAVAVATGTTFAWFSMNNKVTVTGMSVTTSVDSNLLIADSTAGTGMADEEAFTQGINQAVSGVLQPASTVNAVDFFYTYDAQNDGSKIASADIIPYQVVSDNTITVGSTDYAAYVDYVFELKAMNVSGEGRNIVLTKLNLLYDGAATDNTAFRAAIFAQEGDRDNDTYEALGEVTMIYALNGYSYFDDDTAVSAVYTKSAVVVNGDSLALEVADTETKYYKITVRLWIEGEDEDCNNIEFVELTEEWSLDLEFKLLDDTDAADTDIAIAEMGSVANAVYTSDSGNERTVDVDANKKIANGEVVRSYAWKKVGGDGTTLGTEKTYTAAAEGSYYCEITTVLGNVYRTASFEYVAP